jgi:hypothetical protein
VSGRHEVSLRAGELRIHANLFDRVRLEDSSLLSGCGWVALIVGIGTGMLALRRH